MARTRLSCCDCAPVFLKPGDVVEVEIENIGVLRNPVADE
jgi:2-keto-4-pentenoate hydratase/2-oxohepta-3-ene-1,7-dioic acid hydratase in catechol pathway